MYMRLYDTILIRKKCCFQILTDKSNSFVSVYYESWVNRYCIDILSIIQYSINNTVHLYRPTIQYTCILRRMINISSFKIKNNISCEQGCTCKMSWRELGFGRAACTAQASHTHHPSNCNTLSKKCHTPVEWQN